MRAKIFFFLFLFSFLFFLRIFLASAQGPVIITEIMYDLAGSDLSHEWIEIKNISPQEINLKDWRFNDGSNHLLNEPPKNGGQGSLIIPPFSYAILADKADIFLLDHPGFSGIVIDTVMSLNNTAGILKLINEKGEVIEEVSYSKEMGANGNGYSLERVNDFSLQFCQSAILGGTPGRVNQASCLTGSSPSVSPLISSSPSPTLLITPLITPSPSLIASPEFSYFSPSPFLEKTVRIYINEIMPNPQGNDEVGEWIELYNDSPYEVDLTNWELKDASGRSYRFQGEKISPYGYLVLDRSKTKITLNNDEEILTLLTPNGQVAFQISYRGKTLEGYAFARYASKDWRWTSILTPGSANQFSQLTKDQKETPLVSPANFSPPPSGAIINFTPQVRKIAFLIFGFGGILAFLAIFIFRRFFI